MLGQLVRQDIAHWPQTKCGLDPHGSLYYGLLNWIAWNEPYLKKVPVVPIDLRQTNWTVGYNAIRPRAKADPAVIVSNFVQAMSRVWGVDVEPRTITRQQIQKDETDHPSLGTRWRAFRAKDGGGGGS
jgi:hypothetical protein